LHTSSPQEYYAYTLKKLSEDMPKHMETAARRICADEGVPYDPACTPGNNVRLNAVSEHHTGRLPVAKWIA
jgi:hypothetical protein